MHIITKPNGSSRYSHWVKYNTKQDVISMAVKIKLLNFGLFALLVPMSSIFMLINYYIKWLFNYFRSIDRKIKIIKYLRINYINPTN